MTSTSAAAATALRSDADPRPDSFAHVLRRMTFGPTAAALDTALASHAEVSSLIGSLLDAPDEAFVPPGDIDVGPEAAAKSVAGNDTIAEWWIERLSAPSSGFTDRLVWFWHTHFTTSTNKVDPIWAWRQLRTLYTSARGSFGDLLTAMLTDPAMLIYLDGDGSVAEHPNENLGRELMELFTLGRGHYTQDDVVAAAHGLAGYEVDWSTGELSLNADSTDRRRRTFLNGEPQRLDVDRIVEALLSHDALATHITRALWTYFVAPDPDEEVISDLADTFRSSNYDITELLRSMFALPAFADPEITRSRTAFEWYIGVRRLSGSDEIDSWHTRELGQMPFDPPNVAGWPGEARWTRSPQIIARSKHLESRTFPVLSAETPDDMAAEVLRLSAMTAASERTHRVLVEAADTLLIRDTTPEDLSRALFGLALLSPEYAVL